MTDAGGTHEIGSMAEESAKLIRALAGWAREQTGEASDGLSGLAGHAAGSAHDLSEHLAIGSEQCAGCPICRTIHAVRQLSPEVKTHLASAATSLAQAAAAVMVTPERCGESDGVDHIDPDGAG